MEDILMQTTEKVQWKDKIRDLNLCWPLEFHRENEQSAFSFIPYSEKFAQDFFRFFNEDEKETIKYFITNYMSPSFKKMKKVTKEAIEETENFKQAVLERHINMVKKCEEGFVLVILHNNTPIGYMDVHNIHKKECEVALLIGSKDFRGKGLGSIITTYFIRILLAKTPLRSFYAIVNEKNIPAQKICKKVGLRQAKTFPPSYTNDQKNKKVYLLRIK